jgi:hypothetical protein
VILDFPTLTLVHVVLSLVGIFAGLVLVGGLIAGVRLDGWLGAFLVTTVLTNATGFLFTFRTLLPSHIVGGLSLILLPIAIAARYWKHLAGGWRRAFVVISVLTLYLNVFVLVVQLFQKFPGLLVLAPTQKEPAFIGTQLLVLALFIGLGRAALRGYRAEHVAASAARTSAGPMQAQRAG